MAQKKKNKSTRKIKREVSIQQGKTSAVIHQQKNTEHALFNVDIAIQNRLKLEHTIK